MTHSEPSVAARLRDRFDSRVRNRGDAYANGGHVELRPAGAHVMKAAVFGSRATPFICELDWQRAERGEVAWHCGCPTYATEGTCKHLWAMLRTMDLKGLAGDVPGSGALTARPLHAREAAPAQNGTARPRAKASARSAPEWLRTLSSLEARTGAGEAGDGAESATHWASLWFAVNVQLSERQDAIVLEFFSGASPAENSGGRRAQAAPRGGELRQVRLNDQSLAALGGEAHAIVERLLRRPAVDGAEAAAHRRGGEQFGYAVLDDEVGDDLLPRLARSGRLLKRANARALPDAGAPIRLDETALRLHMHMMERSTSWLLTATLVREAHDAPAAADTPRAWPLATAELVLSSGHVLRGDMLHQVEMVTGARQWLEALRKQNVIDVPHRDRGALLEFFANYTGQVPLHLPASLRLTEVVGVPQPCLLLKTLDSYDGRSVEAQLGFMYGEKRVLDAQRPAAWIDEAERRVTRRDFDAEADARDAAVDAGCSFVRTTSGPGPQSAMEVRVPLPRLLDIVSDLAARGWRVELRERRIALAASSDWSVRSGVDWFELQGELRFDLAQGAVPGAADGAAAALPELLQAVRRGERFVALSDGSTGLIPQAWLARLETIARLGHLEGDAVRFKHAQALLLDNLLAERANERVKARMDTRYRKRLEELRDGERAVPIEPPPGFQGELRPYQREGLGWFAFLERLRIGGCLADDMGLGKTVQVLALLESRRIRTTRTHRASIVVVPRSLVFNWKQEAARFTPELRVLPYVGTARHELKSQLRHVDVVLTTYATLLRDIGHIKDVHFDYAILDEAQAIKNEDSQSAKACRLLRADHRLAMSGTPIENHLGELWSLFEFLNPGLLGSVATFRSLSEVEGDAELAGLQRALRPFILRRTKAQVLPDLPAKTEQTMVCELSSDERGHYEQLLRHYRATLLTKVRTSGINSARIHVLEALLRLRQAALHPGLLDPGARSAPSAKFELLLEQLEDLLPQGHKALIFSQFTGLLGLLREVLDARGWRYAYLDGSTRDREGAVRSFQEDPEQRLFLISLRAGGHGLNLTAADYVFILDPWWNPAVEAQAIDRAHRIGQERVVFAYRLIAANTIEEKIVELQARKRELAEAIITADNAVPSSLTAEDLELLLS